jgi:hypothetical protein
MKNNILLTALLASLILYMYSCAGSTPPEYVANYTFSIEKAENNIGNYTTNGMTYSDSCIELTFYPRIEIIKFSIINKLEDSISIIWDDAQYIDVNKGTDKLRHSNIWGIDNNLHQNPTVIHGNKERSDALFRISKVKNPDNPYDIFSNEPLFPKYIYTDNKDELTQKAKFYKGKTFQILLPFQINDIKNNYLFTIRIDDVSVEAYKNEY